MRKRGFTDNFLGGHSEVDHYIADTGFSNGHLIAPGPNRGVHFEAANDGGGGPDATAAGGKKPSGGGTAGGGTTGGGGSGSSGSGTGTTGSGGTTGQGATTTTFHAITVQWQTLSPPTGDTAPPTDTYYSQQWGLTSKTAGINVAGAWKNYSGAGIKVGVIDDGFDYKHSDLSSNYLLNLDYDARTGGLDAFGDPTADKHGTTVMGVIGAERDGTGSVGVAYNAGVAGFRIGYGANGSLSQIADAFGKVLANDMDVVNASWGYTGAYSDNFLSSAFSAIKNAIVNDVANGRDGLGINIVFSAGNGGSSDNVNYHSFQNNPYVITVGATDAYGHVASYSTPGAALLVSAPGTAKTDDRVGAGGYSSSDYINMSGTSYAAPYVAGVVALMLQANPNLGFWDVQEILAYSAKNSDPTSTSWQTNGAHNWNGGGLHFSNNLGFGLIDATAAVKLAESWQYQSTLANMSTESATHVVNAAIPDGTGSLKSQITFASSLDVNKIVVGLNITHALVKDLTVTLTSPSGTSAVLVAQPANGTGGGIVFETTANNFWGEDAKGTWTLTVTDKVTGNVGTLNSWTLTALGDAPDTPTTYIYTDEFATATGSDRLVLNDTSGTATINTAAVTTGSYLDLNPGAVSTIAGKALQIGTDTIIKNVWAGDGNDTIIANDFGNTIQAGCGNDMIVAGDGADKLFGGPGVDTFTFNFATMTADVIADFTAGQDIIDMCALLASIGYSGTDPIGDEWLILLDDGTGGTFVQVDLHNGQSPVTIVDVLGVQPAALHSGTSYGLLLA